MRTIAVVTTSRADYGIYLPVLRALREAKEVQLWLFVTGMHLSPEFGMTADAIEQDGFEIVERVEMLLSSDSPAGIAKSMGLGTLGFAQAYARIATRHPSGSRRSLRNACGGCRGAAFQDTRRPPSRRRSHSSAIDESLGIRLRR